MLHRPTFHFLPAPSWINDPKPFFWDGAYHVFFQYCPGIPYSGIKHWGHAVSRDLAHWEELPIALSPTPGGPDQDGCWTGCVLEHEGRFHILYTGIPHLTRPSFEQVQCLATSDDLVHWRKHPANPVIPASQKPAGFGDTFRDPQAWRDPDDGAWYCVIGGNRPSGDDEFARGAAFLYRSTDLVHWDYLHPLYVGPEIRDECPDFFPLDGPQGRKWVLLSSRGRTHWAIGRYENHRFTPETTGTIDDPLHYAAKTLVDGRGRRILFGWVREDRPRDAYTAAGWSGLLSLPRELSLLPDGTLGQRPVPELASLRGSHHSFGPITLDSGEHPVTIPSGSRLELLARFAPGTATQFGLAVQGTDEILYDRATHTLNGRSLPLADGEPLTLHIFVDHSVVEVFAHDHFAKTIRTYHAPTDNLNLLRVIARHGTTQLESLSVWQL